MSLTAVLADVEVGLDLRFEPFALRFYLGVALVALQVQLPFVVGFPQLISDAEKAETKVVVACEHLDLSFPFEDHLDDGVEVFRFLGFLAHFAKDHIGVYPMPQHHGLPVFPVVFVAHQADLIRVHKVVPMRQVHLLVPEFYPHQFLHQLIAPGLHDFQ